MNAGAKLLVLNGIDKATIDDIVIEAANLKSAFYYYFKSRNELVDAWQKRFWTRIREQTQAAAETIPDGDWSGKPRAWVSAPIHRYLADFKLHEAVYHSVRRPCALEAGVGSQRRVDRRDAAQRVRCRCVTGARCPAGRDGRLSLRVWREGRLHCFRLQRSQAHH